MKKSAKKMKTQWPRTIAYVAASVSCCTVTDKKPTIEVQCIGSIKNDVIALHTNVQC